MHRRAVLITLPLIVAAWGMALAACALHRERGPAHVRFNVRWTGGLSAPDRHSAEIALGLTDGEAVEADTWSYRLANYSREAVRRIVRSPLVSDTFHVNRNDFTLAIEAPDLPGWLRRLLESGRLPVVAWMLGAVGVAPLWYARRQWARTALDLTSALRPGERRVRAALLIGALGVVYVTELVRTAWISDDAAITLRTVLNVVHGYGARFNVDERVQAYTHPLWFLILSVTSAIAGNVFIVTFLMSGLLSVAALGVLMRGARTLSNGALVVLGLMLSKAFVDYSTSGLENPLSHVVLLLTAMAAIRAHEDPDPRWLWLSCAGLAAACLTRPDLVLLAGPLVALVVIRQRPLTRSLVIGAVIVAVPVLVWTALATYYYGFPFPNPAYAKLGAGVPLSDRLVQGGRYFLHSVPRDPLTLALTGLAVFAGAMQRGPNRALAGGIVLYLLYVASIGGDFMEGRFLTCTLVLSALVLVRLDYTPVARAGVFALVLAFGAIGLPRTLLSGASYEDRTIPRDGIADERGFYFQRYGWLNADAGQFSRREWRVDPAAPRRIGITCGGVGWEGIDGGPSLHLIDTCALTDPLLAHLPARPDAGWRIGHFSRDLPDGYEASVRGRVNLLTEPDRHAYYELIRRVTRGDLAARSRLFDIIRLNSGVIPAS